MTYEPESMRLANEHASDLLPEYLAGALDDETRQAVRTHLLTCVCLRGGVARLGADRRRRA